MQFPSIQFKLQLLQSLTEKDQPIIVNERLKICDHQPQFDWSSIPPFGED